MILRLFFLFSVVPVIEIYFLIRVGRIIGPLPTVALLLFISLAGAWLVRQQGFGILRRIQGELAVGRLPAEGLLDGAMVLVGGILLLTPGFFTDFIGLFFLIPFTRNLIKQVVRRRITRAFDRGTVIVGRRWP